MLEPFIDMLLKVHDSGADFIDIVVQKNIHQDILGILVREEYMSLDRDSIEHNHPPENRAKIERLITDDLNQLLNSTIN